MRRRRCAHGTARARAWAGFAVAGAMAAVLVGCGSSSEGDGTRRPAGRAAEYRSRAEAIEAEHDPAAALDAYREAARRYPTAAWPWAGLGRAAAALGRFREAEDAYRTAVRWDSTLVEERVAVAELAREEHRTDEALEWIDGAIARGGESAARLAIRGRILADAGRRAEARKAIDRALALSPGDPAATIARALGFLAADSMTAALADLDGLAERRPEEPDVRSARALVRQQLGDLAGARADLERALELSPHRPRDRARLARLHFAAGSFPEAARHFRDLLADNPHDPVALEGLGSCAARTGNPEEAEEAFRKAIESDPEFAPAYLALGRFRLEEGRVDEAILLLRKARARAALDPPRWEECSVALADAYLLLGEPENALEIAAGILSRFPDSETGRSLRGRALAAGGGGAGSGEALERLAIRPGAGREEILAYASWLLEHDGAGEALELLETLLADHPGDVRVRLARARALGETGRGDDAERELHDLLADPGGADVQRALARFYLGAGRLPDAIFHAKRGESLRDDDPEFAAIIGEAALRLGKFPEARAAFERETALQPGSPGPWMSLGKLEMAAGHPERAAEHFARAQELDPQGWLPAYQRGLAEAAAGRPEEAITAYRLALDRNERVAEAHNNLAWILADLDLDPVLAEVHARRAAELQPDNPSILGTLGWAQYKNRLLDEAVVSLSEAKRLAPDDAMKRYMLGVVQFTRGRRTDARREVEAALQLDPGFERSDSARELLARLEP